MGDIEQGLKTPPGSGRIDGVNEETWQAWQSAAGEMGFVEMGAAAAGAIQSPERVRQWVARGFHADMRWFAASLEKRCQPSLVMEDVASVIILACPYYAEPVRLAGKKLARYACGDDYHDVLLVKLKHLCALMGEHYPDAHFRPYVDTGPVLERYWAQQSGLGWIGKNGNLISRRHGSYIFLASILTNLVVPHGQPHGNFCGSCRACIDACPTGAIVADGVVDSRKCISYMNIEHRGPFSQAPGFEDWIFGCDICQEVCPWPGKFSASEVLDALQPRPAYSQLQPAALAGMEQVDFSALFRKSPIKRTKMAGIKRNLTHLEQEVPT